MLNDLATLAQIVEGALLPLSLIYLAREAQLNVKLTKAQFSHTLTDRLYERYLSSTQNQEFVRFLAKDFSSEELTNEDQWRITLWTNAGRSFRYLRTAPKRSGNPRTTRHETQFAQVGSDAKSRCESGVVVVETIERRRVCRMVLDRNF